MRMARTMARSRETTRIVDPGDEQRNRRAAVQGSPVASGWAAWGHQSLPTVIGRRPTHYTKHRSATCPSLVSAGFLQSSRELSFFIGFADCAALSIAN